MTYTRTQLLIEAITVVSFDVKMNFKLVIHVAGGVNTVTGTQASAFKSQLALAFPGGC